MKETDWKAELQSFSKGVAEDSAEASQLVHKGLERFPKEATAHLPASLGVGLEGLGDHMPGSLDSVQVQEHFNKVCGWWLLTMVFLATQAHKSVQGNILAVCRFVLLSGNTVRSSKSRLACYPGRVAQAAGVSTLQWRALLC